MQRPSKKAAGVMALAVGLATSGISAITKVKPDQFGLRETFYAVIADNTLKPGFHVQFPFVQYTHVYNTNTQRIDFNAGSCRFIPTCDSTSDQNPLTSELVLNYRVKPDQQKLAFHRWAMEGILLQDGYWLLTDIMNTSANAVLGRQSMAQTLANPEKYLKDVYADLSARLEQNNVPVEIESLELKGLKTFYVPTRTMVYGQTGIKASAMPSQPKSELKP